MEKITVDFIGNNHAWNVGTVVTHFFVPALNILVRNLPRRIKNKNCNMSLEVVRRMQLIKRVLPCRVPQIDSH